MLEVFSFSRLNLYETCPYRFYKRYVEGIEEPETYPLALGKGVHKAVEKKLKGMEHESAVLLGIIEADFHPEVEEQELSWLVKNAPIHKLNEVLDVELHFQLPLSDEPDAPQLQGYIDVVGNGYIVDWKTNRVMYDVRDNFQVGLYAWALNQLFGYQKVYGHLYFLRFKKQSFSVFGLEEMEKARVWAYTLAKEIQDKVAKIKEQPNLVFELFPATPQSFCSHCPFAYECHSIFSTLG